MVIPAFHIPLAAQIQPIKWKQALDQEPGWYAGKEAIRIADNLLKFQHDNGGWPKNFDMAKILKERELKQLRKNPTFSQTTIDNSATHTQMRYLARVYNQTGITRFKTSFLKGVDYLLEAQYENGGWPQFYPIRKGYYERITFNDGAMIGVMNLLRNIATGKYEFVDSLRIERSQRAIEKGLEVILETQIEVDGELTAWCAQYGEKNLQPAAARSYELVSISGAESVGIVQYLMDINDPDESIIKAVNSAVRWFEKVKMTDIRVIKKTDPTLARGYDLIIGFTPGNSDPLWARFYEIGTNYPLFPDRDGVINYALSEISYERRVGYRWLGDWPLKLLSEDYPDWKLKWLSEE